MKFKNTITPEIIDVATAVLSKYVPGLNATTLVSAIEAFGGEEAIEATKPLEKPYTVAQIMELLGITKPTVYKMFDDAILTRIKIGRSVRIPAEDVRKLLRGETSSKDNSK